MYDDLTLSNINSLLESIINEASLDYKKLDAGDEVPITNFDEFKKLVKRYGSGHFTTKGMQVLYDHLTDRLSYDWQRKTPGGVLMNRYDVQDWEQHKNLSREYQETVEQDGAGIRIHGNSWLVRNY